jgi:hypothetical protein
MIAAPICSGGVRPGRNTRAAVDDARGNVVLVRPIGMQTGHAGGQAFHGGCGRRRDEQRCLLQNHTVRRRLTTVTFGAWALRRLDDRAERDQRLNRQRRQCVDDASQTGAWFRNVEENATSTRGRSSSADGQEGSTQAGSSSQPRSTWAGMSGDVMSNAGSSARGSVGSQHLIVDAGDGLEPMPTWWH